MKTEDKLKSDIKELKRRQNAIIELVETLIKYEINKGNKLYFRLDKIHMKDVENKLKGETEGLW